MTLSFRTRLPINVCSIKFNRLDLQISKFLRVKKKNKSCLSQDTGKPEYVIALPGNHSMNFCVSWRETAIHSFEKYILCSNLRFFKRLLVTNIVLFYLTLTPA